MRRSVQNFLRGILLVAAAFPMLLVSPVHAEDASASTAGKAILKTIKESLRDEVRITNKDPRITNPDSPYPGMRAYVEPRMPRTPETPLGMGWNAEDALALEPQSSWNYSIDPLDARATLESRTMRYGTRADRAELFMGDRDGDWTTTLDLEDQQLRFGLSF
ncbi:MAG: hypothetical protein ACO376_07210 [Gammaproteobacteria bacterium]|jgi:hypothetical protein